MQFGQHINIHVNCINKCHKQKPVLIYIEVIKYIQIIRSETSPSIPSQPNIIVHNQQQQSMKPPKSQAGNPLKQQPSQSHPQIKIEPWQGPIIPAAKVSPQVIEILRTTKVPELIIPSHTTIPGAAQIYFAEYLKLFSQNRQLNADLIQIFEERNLLAEKYNQLKREENDCEETIRRKRRFANQIKRDFPCPSQNCHKSYGSEGSLTQHVKLKHENFYKSGQYQILLQNMLDQMAKHVKVKQQEPENKKNPVKVKGQKIEKDLLKKVKRQQQM